MKKDLFTYIKGLKALTHSDKWCTNECSLTLKFDNLNPKKLFQSVTSNDEEKLESHTQNILSKDQKNMLKFNLAQNAFKLIN